MTSARPGTDADGRPAGRHIWMNGELVPWDEARVHVLTHALHYGTGVFDSMRAYETPQGPAVFRHAEHVDRLFASASLYAMPIPFSRDELLEATRTLVRDSGLPACYIRPIAYRGAGRMGISPSGSPVDVAIAVWEWGAYLGAGAGERGIRAKVSSWSRISQDSLLPAAKACAHYLNSALAKMEAEAAGYDEAILLDPQGGACEGSGENLFAVRGGTLRTPPLSGSALGGITRDAVLTLARDLGVPVVEEPLSRADLYLADELFLTGTAAEITPVREIDDRPVGSGTRGPVTEALQRAFDDAVHGRSPTYAEWLDVIPAGAPA